MSDTHNLITILSRLPDPRLERSQEHELPDLLAIALCTLLVEGESCYDMEDFAHVCKDWCQTLLHLPGGIPSHDPFKRLFQALAPPLLPRPSPSGPRPCASVSTVRPPAGPPRPV